MRNVFLFIGRYFTFICFLALQVFALSMVFRHNKYQQAVFLGKANEITGYFNARFDKVDDYFHLKEENQRLHRMNDSLLHSMASNFMKPDTGLQIIADTTGYDTSSLVRRYAWREAKVVSNSVREQKNYIQINRGAKHGIKDDMGVVNSDGAVVGVVVNVSENFSQVMSLLHVQRKVNAMMKKSRNSGTIEWDGKSPLFLTLRGIPKSDTISAGDTVLTSLYSFNFPPGLMIGIVDGIVDDKSTNFFVLRIRPAANFQNLQHVHVIENLQQVEQVKLDKDTQAKIDEVNKKR